VNGHKSAARARDIELAQQPNLPIFIDNRFNRLDHRYTSTDIMLQSRPHAAGN
jgi:hypothetical protein